MMRGWRRRGGRGLQQDILIIVTAVAVVVVISLGKLFQVQVYGSKQYGFEYRQVTTKAANVQNVNVKLLLTINGWVGVNSGVN